MWCTRECISNQVQFSWHPFDLEAESLHFFTKTLESGVFNFENVFFENAEQGLVISDDVKGT